MKLTDLKKYSEGIIDLNDFQIDLFNKYFHLLSEWNEKINLTALTGEGDVVEKHFLDCILPLSLMDISEKKIADLGSGAGFPGVVWAICYPDSQIDLIEATGKKALFLNVVIKELGLNNVKVINERVEKVKDRGKYDIVTSRAMAHLNVLLEVGAPLLKLGGKLIALKGSKAQEEIDESSNCMKVLKINLEKIDVASLPSDGSMRTNILFVKNGITPKKYPRDWASIISKPL